MTFNSILVYYLCNYARSGREENWNNTRSGVSCIPGIIYLCNYAFWLAIGSITPLLLKWMGNIIMVPSPRLDGES